MADLAHDASTEEGRLRRCGRARFDVAHGNLVQVGTAFLGQDKARMLCNLLKVTG